MHTGVGGRRECGPWTSAAEADAPHRHDFASRRHDTTPTGDAVAAENAAATMAHIRGMKMQPWNMYAAC